MKVFHGIARVESHVLLVVASLFGFMGPPSRSFDEVFFSFLKNNLEILLI